MKNKLVALLVGTLFGMGLTISGMTQPQKVIAFLDIFGDWDPTLGFVMAGAIAVHFLAYRFQKHQTSPLFADQFYLPGKKKIDSSLILGSALFGIGWGIGGYCPGPALTSLVSFQMDAVIFVIFMTAGMFLQDSLQKYISTKKN